MDPPPHQISSLDERQDNHATANSRSQSFSQKSDDSQTAAEFITSQLQLEADAREALPYKFEECTRPIGKLRQVLFSCLTCNPPPADLFDPYTPAGVCYSCSIQCHGEHILVELFNKRNFVCDCGTKRLPTTSPCTLRLNQDTNTQGGAHSEEPAADNKYNQNFRNRFCGCECDYDAHQQKGTMFQCLGLGTTESGGCGEDWWHSSCIVGLGEDWYEVLSKKGTPGKAKADSPIPTLLKRSDDPASGSNRVIAEEAVADEAEDLDLPLPPGFPEEDDFEGFICYKCVDAHPWIKRYAGASGFLGPVFKRSAAPSPEKSEDAIALSQSNDKKRKAEDIDHAPDASAPYKRVKDETIDAVTKTTGDTYREAPLLPSNSRPACKLDSLPAAPNGQISLFFKADFREHLCHCADCFPRLKEHEQLLEEEDTYEPPISISDEEAGGSTAGSGSIYDRGESALKNVDRVRAIEGVMAYNHLKDKLKPFFQQFAESGQAISAEDIKAHFAKMRGDEEAIKEAGEGAKSGDNRKEQSGC